MSDVSDVDNHIRKELEKYLNLALKYHIEINGKNFVDLIEIIGGAYFEY